jgi:protein-disulfide isomerase
MDHQQKNRLLPVSVLIAALLVSGSVVFSAIYKMPSGASGTAYTAANAAANPGAATINTPAGNATTQLGPRDAILGKANAPVTYIDYGDYQCPFCNRYFTDTFPSLKSEYVDTGKIKMVFRDLAFLGPESLAAANAAQCANDQGKLWPYHDELYTGKSKDYASGGSENDGYFTRSLFLTFANQIGLDMPKFTSCLDGNNNMAYVAQEKTAASDQGINSTPTFSIDGTEVQGSQPLANFEAVINQALASK